MSVPRIKIKQERPDVYITSFNVEFRKKSNALDAQSIADLASFVSSKSGKYISPRNKMMKTIMDNAEEITSFLNEIIAERKIL